mmetsp:Transcript_36167/g.87483  ORF Transcript_36167/g.87483 Transcript_36167/m.87483 type:complete len:925 (+) Transcript_36167:62-2836(+)
MQRLRLQSQRRDMLICLPFILCLLSGIITNNNHVEAFNLASKRVSISQRETLRQMVSRGLDDPKTAVDIIIEKQEMEPVDFLPDMMVEQETSPKPKPAVWLDAEGQLSVVNGADNLLLLDGLEPTKWTGIVPTSTKSQLDDRSSLFLQVEHTIPQAHHKLSLGNLVSCNRMLTCSRLTRYWMGPAFGDHAKDVPVETQFMLMEMEENGPYALLLPLVDGGFRASLEPSKHNKDELEIMCYSESGEAPASSSAMKALYVAVGDDPFELVQRGMQEVSDNLGTFRTLHHKKIPESVNDFGWCTWDAFYSKVNPEGILKGVSELKKAGVPPRNLILDDGWQEVSPHPADWDQSADATATLEEPNIISELGNAAFSQIAALVSGYYDKHVQNAPHGGISNRVWTMLAKTVLKKGLWNFFDSETDFNRQLDSFEPNFKFQDENGKAGSLSLKDLVHELKTDLGLKKVYCWHALHGYWRGVTTALGDSVGIDVVQVKTKPTKHLKRMEPQMGFDTISLFGVGMMKHKDDLAKFYKHLHAPLVEAGVDGVKVDVQSGVSAAGSGIGKGGVDIGKIYTEAMEDSVSKNFASDTSGAVDCINCMCHSTENLYRYKVTAVARASDDFYPLRPESHSVHLVNVAYNSLFLGEICLPDWDMFHSKHESAALHAAARAVGGCPIYVSDMPGEHDVQLLRKLVLPDGSVLRAQLPGRPTRDCLFADVGKDGKSALKIWNANKSGSGVIGAFNVQGVAWNFKRNENEQVDASPAPVVTQVRPHDVETLRGTDGPFAVWNHRSASLEVLESGDSPIDVSLDSRQWDIFTIVPVQSSDKVKWAPIGLGDMLNSGGAIEYQSGLEEMTTMAGVEEVRRTTTTSFSVRGPGKMVAYCDPCPSNIILGTDSVPSELEFNYNKEIKLLEFMLPGDPHQVTIAWDT